MLFIWLPNSWISTIRIYTKRNTALAIKRIKIILIKLLKNKLDKIKILGKNPTKGGIPIILKIAKKDNSDLLLVVDFHLCLIGPPSRKSLCWITSNINLNRYTNKKIRVKEILFLLIIQLIDKREE